LLFRSEEHVERWCKSWNLGRGGLLTPEQAWALAAAWYSEDRRDFAWRRKTKDEAQAILDEIGLASPFWQL